MNSKFKVNDLIMMASGRVGTVITRVLQVKYVIRDPIDSDTYSCKHEEVDRLEGEEGEIVKTISEYDNGDKTSRRIREVPEFYKYHFKPIVGCIFIKDRKRYIVEYICDSKYNTYICRNMKNNTTLAIDSGNFEFRIIKVLERKVTWTEPIPPGDKATREELIDIRED